MSSGANLHRGRGGRPLFRDPWISISLLVSIAVVAVYGLGGASAADSSRLTFACYAVFLLLGSTAALSRLRPSAEPRERRFWTLVAIGLGFWLLAAVHLLLPEELFWSSIPLQTLADLGFALYYLALVQAAEQRPELGPVDGSADLDRQLEFWGLQIFAVGLLLYFVLIPNIAGPAVSEEGLALEGYLLFFSLDLYLLLRFFYLQRMSREESWSRCYALLAFGHALWAVTDIYEMLTRLPDSSWEIPPWLTPFWYLPFLTVVFAARLSLRVAEAASSRSSGALYLHSRPRRLVLFLFVLVLLHLGVGVLGGSDVPGYASRGLLIIALTMGLGSLAQLQYRALDDERDAALAELQLSEETLRDHNELLRNFNGQLATRVREQTSRVRETRDIALQTLARLTESRDHETGRHLERIAAFSTRLAEVLAEGPWRALIDGEYIDELRRSSPLHDIGKVGIPDAILLKPGPLSEEEREVMKTHTTLGGDTLRSIIQDAGGESFLRMAMEIAYSHHEQWSGRGYPAGLVGAEIPRSARIVALADAYDAITSIRPYKEAVEHGIAVERIVRDRGEHFDPAVVDAFLVCAKEFPEIRRHLDEEDAGGGQMSARA